MRNFKIVTILFMIILTSSCENGSNDESGINYLKDTKWIFLGFQSHDTHVMDFKPQNLKEMDIEFNHDTHTNTDNWIHAISSCNFFDGNYSVADPDIIRIDNLYSTLINCEGDTIRDWEERYYNELKNAKNYHIAGDSLIIETKMNTDIIFLTDSITN
jgi:heat shock protein HslJ